MNDMEKNKYLAEGKPLRINCPDRKKWLEERGDGIGASEVGTLMGVNKWDTPYQLWRRKKGLDGPVEMNKLMLIGTLCEDAVAQYFAIETGKEIIKSSASDILYVHPQKPYLRVTPDRLFWIDPDGKRHSENKGILECKTSQMDITPDTIPPQYFCQVQYQMGVMQKDHAALAWLTRGREFGYKYIDFDPEFFAYMVNEVDRFWNECILGDREPEATTSEDVVRKYSRPELGKTVEAGKQIIEAYTRLKEVRAERLAKEKEEDELTEMLKVFCSDAEAITYSGEVLATWKATKASEKFDKALFERENPDMYARYLKMVDGPRRFSLK